MLLSVCQTQIPGKLPECFCSKHQKRLCSSEELIPWAVPCFFNKASVFWLDLGTGDHPRLLQAGLSCRKAIPECCSSSGIALVPCSGVWCGAEGWHELQPGSCSSPEWDPLFPEQPWPCALRGWQGEQDVAFGRGCVSAVGGAGGSEPSQR